MKTFYIITEYYDMSRLMKRKQNSNVVRTYDKCVSPQIVMLSLGNGIPNGEGVNVNLSVGDAFTQIVKGGNVPVTLNSFQGLSTGKMLKQVQHDRERRCVWLV